MGSDLYEILEIESSASSSEIKRAYRKLALKFHPDKVTEGDRETAESRFKEISHAYEVLIDEVKREEYDLYGTTGDKGPYSEGFSGNPFENFYGGHQSGQEFDANDFYQFFNGMNGSGQQYRDHNSGRSAASRTDDARLEIEVTLEDLYKGKIVRTTSTRDIICDHCKGTGAKKNALSKKCSACEGNGYVTRIRRIGAGLVTQEHVKCEKCDASGVIYRPKDKCKKCKGKKVVEETKILEFEILKGSKSNESIILKGESDQYPGMVTGDVILTFKCTDHPVFSRKGDDLFTKYKIPLVDALCGFSRVLVKHLDGRGIFVSTPKGKVIRPSDFIRIKNEGMPIKVNDSSSWFRGSQSRRGDLYIEIDIEFPQDSWYLEKNDISKIKNLLPNKLLNKRDAEKQLINEESLPEANIDVITDFTIARPETLPDYDVPENEEESYTRHEDIPAQPECNPQ
ncbi:uncharacterized protein PRCAT00002405001 [Priceomyces carsonii]|uniref:uncharacterized protein n=1 Tax=Priceomyces carsonii TaxID=28549 RepID=UPI002EDA57AC|nr:unnamed protein product [Priceomyces carsonii]